MKVITLDSDTVKVLKAMRALNHHRRLNEAGREEKGLEQTGLVGRPVNNPPSKKWDRPLKQALLCRNRPYSGG